MPADFERCVRAGGRVRRVSGPHKRLGLAKGEYMNVCFLHGEMFRGERKKVKSAKADALSKGGGKG